ncbi:MAG: hypothetical protein ABIZ50_00820 [Solirubrobacterales bacterium]
MTDHVATSQLGPEGDACTACRAPLAVDQRYCLQCGHRRGAPRVDFGELLPVDPVAATSSSDLAPGAATIEPRGAAQSPWTPMALVGSIATLGLMLLLGVMIGKDDSPTQITAAPPVTEVGSTAAAGPAEADKATNTSGADTTGGSDSKKASDSSRSGDSAAANETAPAADAQDAQPIDDGALDALNGATGDEAAQASKNLPDTVALPGEPPPTDNEAPGAGGDAQVIK